MPSLKLTAIMFTVRKLAVTIGESTLAVEIVRTRHHSRRRRVGEHDPDEDVVQAGGALRSGLRLEDHGVVHGDRTEGRPRSEGGLALHSLQLAEVQRFTLRLFLLPRNWTLVRLLWRRRFVKWLGPNSIENFWLEFWLEKSLEFWLEIPHTKKMLKNG